MSKWLYVLSISQVSSQTSSVSSCDDYIIVLPDCFDTSRPLDKSSYNSVAPQPDGDDAPAADPDILPENEEESVSEAGRAAPKRGRQERTEDTWPPTVPPASSSVNQMLCASQTLDTVTLTPEVVPPPGAPLPPDPLVSPPALYSPRLGPHSSSHSQLKIDIRWNIGK